MQIRWSVIHIVFWLLCDSAIVGHYGWQFWNLHLQRMVLEAQYRKAQLIHQKVSSFDSKGSKLNNQKKQATMGANFSEKILHSSRRFGLSLVSFQSVSSANSRSEYQGKWMGTLKQWKFFLQKGVLDVSQVKTIFGVQCSTKNCFEIEATIAKGNEQDAS